MATPNEIKKDTVYIDVDDEITAIIEKIQNSPQKIVALVLPKRATVLQSAVNMKLLKRMAGNAKKHVVLITSEAGLLPLAGAVGLHVARSLQSKPEIPSSSRLNGPGGSQPTTVTADDELEAETDDFDPDANAERPIGGLAGFDDEPSPVKTASSGGYVEPETIELDDDDDDDAPEPQIKFGTGSIAGAAGAAGGAAAQTSANTSAQAANGATKAVKGKDKKLKVPNFNKFRLILVLLILGILLLVGGGVYANTVLPKALITLKTDSSNVDTRATLTLDPTATEVDADSKTLPAKFVTKQQTGSQQVSSTGQKNNGTKATGTVTMTAGACTADVPPSVPAGTGVSSGSATFITQETATFSPAISGGKCTYTSSDETSVTAQTAGASGNIAKTSFSVAGRSDVKASSDAAFSGGTDNIVKVVTQADIDSAKNKMAAADTDSVRQDLTTKLTTAGYKAISASLHASDPVVTPSAAVGDQADTVSVTQATTYTLYGVKTADIKQIVTSNVNKQIDTTKQQILKDGVDNTKYQVTSTVAGGPLQVVISVTSLAGPDIDTSKLAAQLAGKKSGDIQSTVRTLPGVSDVTVKYSPFWVKKVPKNTAKITIDVQKSGD